MLDISSQGRQRATGFNVLSNVSMVTVWLVEQRKGMKLSKKNNSKKETSISHAKNAVHEKI